MSDNPLDAWADSYDLAALVVSPETEEGVVIKYTFFSDWSDEPVMQSIVVPDFARARVVATALIEGAWR